MDDRSAEFSPSPRRSAEDSRQTCFLCESDESDMRILMIDVVDRRVQRALAGFLGPLSSRQPEHARDGHKPSGRSRINSTR